MPKYIGHNLLLALSVGILIDNNREFLCLDNLVNDSNV